MKAKQTKSKVKFSEPKEDFKPGEFLHADLFTFNKATIHNEMWSLTFTDHTTRKRFGTLESPSTTYTTASNQSGSSSTHNVIPNSKD
jgi:hypothetical protein